MKWLTIVDTKSKGSEFKMKEIYRERVSNLGYMRSRQEETETSLGTQGRSSDK